MPYRSKAQRRWMWANRPDIAKKWDEKYGTAIDMNCGGYVEPAQSFVDGGYVQPGPVLNLTDGGGFVTVRHGDEELTVVLDPPQVIDMEGNDITDTPKGKNALAKAKSSYTVEQEEETQARIDRNVEGFGNLLAASPTAILEMTPIIGDAMAAYEVYEELRKNPVNWVMVGILAGATAVGLIPGIGDAAAAGIRRGAKMLSDGSQEALSKLKGRNLDYVCNYSNGGIAYYSEGSGCKVVATAGRKAKAIDFYIRYPDGRVEQMNMTPADFRNLTGIGASAVKKSGGRIKGVQGFEGAQWSKNPDDFPEFKTGQTVAEGEFIDPSTVTFKEAGDKARRLPQSLDNAVRAAIRKNIDDVVFPHFKQKVDDILANPEVVRDYDFELDEWIETPVDSGFNSITGWRNGAKNKELSREISDSAWNDVVGAMEEYKEFGADAWNKIINYAKQQSSYLFSFKMPAKMSKGAQKAADQADNPYTAEATKHQGIMARAGKDPELEFQKNYKNAAESGSSDAIRFLLREAEGLRTTLTVGASNPFQAQRFVGIPMEEIASDLKLLDQAIIDINTTEIDRLLKKYDVGTAGYNSGGYVNPLISY